MLLTEYDRELHMKIVRKEAYEEGFKEGYEEGYKIGLALGPEGNQSRFILLLNRLLDSGRMDDLAKASADPLFRKKMYAEFGIE